jgi:hypothetical protein
MKKFLLLFVLVAVIVVAERVLEENTIQENIAGSLNRDKSQFELVTYDNPDYGIRLTMPDDWYVYEEGGLVVSPYGKQYLYKEDARASLEIRIVQTVANGEDVSEAARGQMNQWFRGLREANEERELDFKQDNIVLDNHEVWRAKISGFDLISGNKPFWRFGRDDGSMGEGVFYWFIHGWDIYRMHYAYPASERDKFEPMLKNIANSLRFPKSSS